MAHNLYPFQQQIFDRLTKSDDRGMIQFTGRQSGKTTISQYIKQWAEMQNIQKPNHKILTTAQVDGKPWHTISCKKEVSIWIRENGKENGDWFEHIDHNWTYHSNMFDISEEFYMMVVLRFGR